MDIIASEEVATAADGTAMVGSGRGRSVRGEEGMHFEICP